MTVKVRPPITRAFAAHLWLAAKGFEPLSVEADGDGGYIFRWPQEAADALAKFPKAKAHLNTLIELADQRGGAR